MSDKLKVTSAASTLRAAGSKALAVALVTGISEAAENGHPLTELQQINMATMTVMAYAEILEAVRSLEVDAMLDSREE